VFGVSGPLARTPLHAPTFFYTPPGSIAQNSCPALARVFLLIPPPMLGPLQPLFGAPCLAQSRGVTDRLPSSRSTRALSFPDHVIEAPRFNLPFALPLQFSLRLFFAFCMPGLAPGLFFVSNSFLRFDDELFFSRPFFPPARRGCSLDTFEIPNRSAAFC